MRWCVSASVVLPVFDLSSVLSIFTGRNFRISCVFQVNADTGVPELQEFLLDFFPDHEDVLDDAFLTTLLRSVAQRILVLSVCSSSDQN